jgi:hypothetical protein
MDGHHLALTNVPPGKIQSVFIEWEAVWALGPVWIAEKILLAPGFDSLPIQPITSYYTSYGIRLPIVLGLVENSFVLL